MEAHIPLHMLNTLNSIIEPLPLCILAVNSNMEIVAANESAGIHAGVPVKDLIGKRAGHAVLCVNRDDCEWKDKPEGWCASCGLLMIVKATFAHKSATQPMRIVLPEDNAPNRVMSVTAAYMEAAEVVLLTCMDDPAEGASSGGEADVHCNEIIDTARSIFHELYQSLQIALGNIEMLMLDTPDSDPRHALAEDARQHLERAGKVSRLLLQIQQLIEQSGISDTIHPTT